MGEHHPARRPEVRPGPLSGPLPERDSVVRVVPDEPAIDRSFDYLVPARLAARVEAGSIVRVPLHGRKVGGWVVERDVEPPAGVALKTVTHVTGAGPEPALLDLAEWAAWRWAGRPAHFLRTASPPGAVRGLPPARDLPAAPTTVPADALVADDLVADALARDRAVLRLPPAADPFPLVVGAVAGGRTLVVTPAHAAVRHLAARLRRAGIPVATLPGDWAQARAGCAVVLGARAAAWGPVPGLARVVVLDEHDEALQEEASPTWHARDVAVERARRLGVPCVLVSPCPSLEALGWGGLLAPARNAERAGWPFVDVVDRRREDPLRSDLYSSRLVDLVRSGARVVCVLNRKGRARLLACAACSELARCERCDSAVEQTEDRLRCRRCAAERPVVCQACGAGRLKVLRLGVSRAREDLERLARVPVAEVTGDVDPTTPLPEAPVLVGTEAVLHRVEHADAVAFLDLDQELLAGRYRAGEQALALLARAARLVGGRAGGGRLLLQTRLPRHEVVEAVLHADPGRFTAVERRRREELGFPPFGAMAHLSGPPASGYAAALGQHLGVQVLGPVDGAWLARAADHRTLCDALAATPRPPGRLRVAVDPPRV